MELLKLVALDRDDLDVVSTHLQDATLSVGDVIWRPAEKRLVINVETIWTTLEPGYVRPSLPELFGRSEEEVFDHLCRSTTASELEKLAGDDPTPVLTAARLVFGSVNRPR